MLPPIKQPSPPPTSASPVHADTSFADSSKVPPAPPPAHPSASPVPVLVPLARIDPAAINLFTERKTIPPPAPPPGVATEVALPAPPPPPKRRSVASAGETGAPG